MAFINWEKTYEVGINAMDEEHKKLINIINNLFEAMRQGKAKEVINSVLNELVDYTKTHFGDEEKLLEKYNYPEIDYQYKAHKEFVNKIQEFQNKLNQNNLLLSIEIFNFLKDWLLNHILHLDKKYGEFLNKLGVS